MNNRVPFLDLVAPHLELREELVAVFNEALDTGGFVGGPMVENFERDFAQYCGVEYCAGVGSGTDALRFALIAAGVEEGDVVVTVPNSFIATSEAISQAGASPAFVDIDKRTYNMDPEKLREYLETQCYLDETSGRPVDRKTGRRVSALVPVHLYGQTAEMDAILGLAEKYGLYVIEDACQAHGAEYYSIRQNRWLKAGSMGLAAAFSFYPGKNLGACGEGGAVTTNDEGFAAKVRMLRDHGQTRKYRHEMEGYNGRLDSIQAGFLRVKLRCLAGWNESRRRKARYYDELLGRVDGIVVPHEPSWSRGVYHLYVIRSLERAGLEKHLAENHVFTGLHYPVPLHLLKPYAGIGYGEGDFPVSESVSREILSLPMYPGIRDAQQEWVAGKIAEHLTCNSK